MGRKVKNTRQRKVVSVKVRVACSFPKAMKGRLGLAFQLRER